ncbi:DNA methyltransferase [Brevibacterium yomogidense]|uniref:DNA methyltransferase n=1 Tax=Brevibacterium yomogidense TaxID=946573 RepID=UPI0015C5DC8F|nr:DNA methyltransferase [Brevibacterium yomogidense]
MYQQSNLVGVSAAARILGVSNSTVYRMVDSGILTPTKTPGGQRRFDTNQLGEYLAKSRTIAAPQNPSRALAAEEPAEKPPSKIDARNKLNDLTGAEWMPLTKSFTYQKGLGSKHPHAQIERQHPAPFSFQDVSQLISFFTKEGMVVLDPFGGVGSTAKAAAVTGRKSISIELQKHWNELAIERLETEVAPGDSSKHTFINDDSREALLKFEPESVDFVITSPPYWSILNKKADHKVKQERLANDLATNYSDSDPKDLANIADYSTFLKVLASDFIVPSARALKSGKYLCMIVSDFRNKSKFVSFHSDLIQELDNANTEDGATLALQGVKVLLQNHKSLLPYGYPFAYVENIHHQYILIFRKVAKP